MSAVFLAGSRSHITVHCVINGANCKLARVAIVVEKTSFRAVSCGLVRGWSVGPLRRPITCGQLRNKRPNLRCGAFIVRLFSYSLISWCVCVCVIGRSGSLCQAAFLHVPTRSWRDGRHLDVFMQDWVFVVVGIELSLSWLPHLYAMTPTASIVGMLLIGVDFWWTRASKCAEHCLLCEHHRLKIVWKDLR